MERSHGHWGRCVLVFALAAQAGCQSEDEPKTNATSSALTTEFQDGLNGYDNTTDGHITSSGGGNGANDFTGTTAVAMKNTVSNYESEILMRLGGLTLPAGAQVTGATLHLKF